MRFQNVLVLAAALGLSAPALAQGVVRSEFTLAAAKKDLKNVPVSLPFAVDANQGDARLATVEVGGKTLPAQLTTPGLLCPRIDVPPAYILREVHFIIPEVKADAEIKGKVTVVTKADTKGDVFAFQARPGDETELTFGKRPVLRYVYHKLDESTKEKREATFKVYHHVYDPDGTRLVTKGVGGLYTHHRGIFYGFKTVTYGDNKTVDIWHCTGDTYQGHEKVLAEEGGPALGRQRVLIGWHGKGKEKFAEEERELTVWNTPGGTTIDFASKLKSLSGTVKLDGDPQHAGFHFRADNEVADKTKGQTVYVRPDGTDKAGATRNWPAQKEHVNLPWDAMSFVLGEKRYTAAYLDKPTNPKEARYSERDYGRFGSYFVTEVPEGKPLTVSYRVWLQNGQMKPEEVAAQSEAFVNPPKMK